LKIHGVYTCDDMLDSLETYHQRAWAADWEAWKLAVTYFAKDTKYSEGPEWCVRWVADPWAGPPGWAFGPYASEAYSYTLWTEVTVP
jgi:hypothetical protein